MRLPERLREPSCLPTPKPWATAGSVAPTAPASTVVSPPMGHGNGRVVAVGRADDVEAEMMAPASDASTWVGDDGQVYRVGPCPPRYTDSIEERTRFLGMVRSKFGGDWQVVAVDDDTITLVDGQPPRRFDAGTKTISADARPTQAAEAAAVLAREGKTLVEWDVHDRRASWVRFTPFEASLRARLCSQLKLEQWELGDTSVLFGDGGLEPLAPSARPPRREEIGGLTTRAPWSAVTVAGVPRCRTPVVWFISAPVFNSISPTALTPTSM